VIRELLDGQSTTRIRATDGGRQDNRRLRPALLAGTHRYGPYNLHGTVSSLDSQTNSVVRKEPLSSCVEIPSGSLIDQAA
jgi:hypothetical protein